jgi:alpha(1,3/1,4) fucosyltransferase
VPTLKVAFSDGAKTNNPAAVRILSLLTKSGLAVESTFNDAELLIYSDFGEQHWAFNGLKIYITGENMVPDFDQCDLAFSPLEDLHDPRCIRLPYYAQVLPTMGSLIRGPEWQPQSYLNRPMFCSFVASNPRGSFRNAFFKKLNRLKKVDSAGRHFNNFGSRIDDKLNFLKNYRFNLAFENSQSPGYVTEKLIEPLLMGCIPIYWGAPDVAKDFNPACMINVSDFSDFGEAIDYILQADRDESIRLRHLSAPVFQNNIAPEVLNESYLLNPIIKLLSSGKKPGPRKYRKRRLREHVYQSGVNQTLASLGCRLEGILWKLGLR